MPLQSDGMAGAGRLGADSLSFSSHGLRASPGGLSVRTGVGLPGQWGCLHGSAGFHAHDLGPARKWALWRLQGEDAQGNMGRGQVRPELARLQRALVHEGRGGVCPQASHGLAQRPPHSSPERYSLRSEREGPGTAHAWGGRCSPPLRRASTETDTWL